MLVDQARLEPLKTFIAEEIKGKARYFEVNQVFPERFWVYLCEELNLFDWLKPGDDLGFGTFLEAIRLLSTEFASLGAVAAAHAIYGIWALEQFGTEQHRPYLSSLYKGQTLAAFAFSEPDLNLAHKLPETVARQTETGWVLTGYKHMVSNVSQAKQVLVLAQLVNVSGEKDLGLLLVDTSLKGVTVEAELDKPGLRAMPLAPIRFEQVALPAEACLGQNQLGQSQYQAILLQMRLVIAAQSLGIAQGVFDKGLADSKIKRGFGKRPIDVPLNQAKFAELAAKLTACRAAYDQLLGQDQLDAHQVALLKLLTAKTAQEVADEVIRVTGAYSFVADNDLERYVRDAAVVANYGGSLADLKQEIAQVWL